MGKNIDLIQEMERHQAFRSNPRSDRVFPVSREKADRDDCRLDHELTRRLVQQIFPRHTPGCPRVVVFAGIDHGNGCSQVAISASEILSENGPGAVCLVEANFRSPALAGMLRSPNYHGMTDALLREGPVRSFMNPVCDDRFWLLTCGPAATDSLNLLTSQRMGARFAELREEFDFVIVDAPPLTRYADAVALSQLSDGIVLVLEAESTRRTVALAAAENLRSSGITILGAVLNKRTYPIPEKIYRRL